MNTPTHDDDKRRKIIIRHVTNVREDCVVLAERLIERGETNLAHNLIANGYRHDNSKFYSMEWLYLNDETKEHCPDLFKAAHLQHITSPANKHHPEAWIEGIHDMDRLHLAEFVCDIHSRSTEFGSDLRSWIKDVALKKWGFTVQSKPYKNVKFFVDLLLDKPFT